MSSNPHSDASQGSQHRGPRTRAETLRAPTDDVKERPRQLGRESASSADHVPVVAHRPLAVSQREAIRVILKLSLATRAGSQDSLERRANLLGQAPAGAGICCDMQ